jgi:hypothetical protein
LVIITLQQWLNSKFTIQRIKPNCGDDLERPGLAPQDASEDDPKAKKASA